MNNKPGESNDSNPVSKKEVSTVTAAKEELKSKVESVKSKIPRKRKAEIPKIGQAVTGTFARENNNRHRSERVIDRYLVKSEREDMQKMKRKFLAERQKEREEEKEERIKQEATRKQKIIERREKFKDLDHYKALLRIVKFIQKPGKYSKCLSLLSNLLKENIDFFCPNTLMNVLDTLVKQDAKSEKSEDIKVLQDLYAMLWEYAYNEQDEFTPYQMEMLQNYVIPVHIEGQFFTDDSYQFNQAAKAFQNLFDDLEIYSESHDEYLEDYNNNNYVFNFLKSPEESEKNELGIFENSWIYADKTAQFDHFNAFLKRQYFMSALKTLFPLYKNTWAKGTITQLLKDIYKEKEKLNDSEQEEVIKMMDQINSKSVMKNQYFDSKIITNAAQSLNPVVDGRSSRVVIDGLEAWSSRQAKG